MTHLVTVGSDESTTLILWTFEWSPTQFVLQCDQWFHNGLKCLFHYLLLLEQKFGWVLYPSPFPFMFALHLDWSLNASVNEKIKCSLDIFELVFHFGLWHKLNIFFSLVLLFLEMHNRSVKRLTGKKLSVDKQFFEDII